LGKVKHLGWICFGILFVLFVIFLYIGLHITDNANATILTLQEKTQNILDNNQLYIEETSEFFREGFYSLGKMQQQYSGTYDERRDRFTTQAKGWILGPTFKGKMNMADWQINSLLITIFKYADDRMVDPRIPLAYIWTESHFNIKAVSKANCKGLYQFFPATMKLYLGDEYKVNAEFDPVLSTKAWFKYYDMLYNMFYEVTDIKEREIWICSGYVGNPTRAYEAYKDGISAIEYDMAWKDYHKGYGDTIWTRYQKLLEIIV
jgi:hypothetical protein